jgi:hypothetical protein
MNEDVELKTCACGRTFYAWVPETTDCVVCAMKKAGVTK